MIGKLVWDDTIQSPRPGVLIAPAFGGLGPFEVSRAQELAQCGYVALVIDYYGEGKRASTPEEATQLMTKLQENRDTLARRMGAALTEIRNVNLVDSRRIGAMGYCFGGKAVLDLARTGVEFQACIAIHGVYDAPKHKTSHIIPSVMILHGWDDPLAPPESLFQLAQELTSKSDDWQLHAFGHTGHAFTNPKAQSPDTGMAFNSLSNSRAKNAITEFFAEKLGQDEQS